MDISNIYKGGGEGGYLYSNNVSDITPQHFVSNPATYRNIATTATGATL